MDKTVIVLSSIAFVLIAMTFIFLGIKYTENETKIKNLGEQLAQQKQKNELLQEENASLHDHVWSLHQNFMKEDAQ